MMRSSRPLTFAVFAVICGFVLFGCQLVTSTPTPIPDSIATPTATEFLRIMCTPPACWEDEQYHCPDECPGGCGTVCATRTPDPAASPTPAIPSFAEICALDATTPGMPAMALCADRESARVGEMVQIAAEFRGLERLEFLRITGTNSDGMGDFSARLRLGGHTATPVNNGAHLVVERAQSDGNRVYLLLRAQSVGLTSVSLQVIPTSPDVQAGIAIRVEP